MARINITLLEKLLANPVHVLDAHGRYSEAEEILAKILSYKEALLTAIL
jgi:hypothetical protein